jgi:NAD(P)-dependent dehydrogenase (short-subunit alcohol dehydrogenase family)
VRRWLANYAKLDLSGGAEVATQRSVPASEGETTIVSTDASVFLITGGSRGIGEAIALSAARAGYHVLLTYFSDKSAADSVVERIRAVGGKAQAIQADTSKEADVERLFAAAERLGRLGVLVYNSGITGANSRLADATTETISRVLEVNLLGALICGREAVRRMSTDSGGGGGSIVFISSRAALYGSPGEYVWYAASKGGIDSLVSGLAREVATQGIRVNAVSPGVIDTEIHAPGRLQSVLKLLPMQRAGEPEEVAAAVMFLASDAASYVSGANLAVGGAR